MTNIIGLDVHFGDGPCDDPECCPPRETEKKIYWEYFPCYLLDYCEGDIISEEGLQRQLADFIDSDYNKEN